MAYALGIEVSQSEVRTCVAVQRDETEEVGVVRSELFVEGQTVAVGDEAQALGAEQPAGMVRDIIESFAGDRLWFAGGRMLTPDEAMYELLAGVVAAITRDRSSPPISSTVVPYREWDSEVAGRFGEVVERLHLHAVEIVAGCTAGEAALDAATRLPAARPVVDSTDDVLPGLSSTFGATEQANVASPTRNPERREEKSTVPGIIVFVVISVALLAAVIAVLNRSSDDESTDDPTPTTTNPPVRTVSVTTTLERSLVLGVVGTSNLATTVRAFADEVSTANPVFGRDTFVVAYDSSDVVGNVEQLRGQGAAAIITDLEEASLADLLSTSAPYAVCITGAAAANSASTDIAEQIDSVRVVARGPDDSCAEVFALAAIRANSLDPSRVAASARDLINEGGIECDTFAQCSVFVAAQQPISFAIDGQTVELFDTKGTP